MNIDWHKFEVVNVSFDDSEQSFKENIKSIPWITLPFSEFRSNHLKDTFGVQGIPTLIVLNKKGEVITREGRRDIKVHGEDCIDIWMQNLPQDSNPSIEPAQQN